jgi:hypothetical protein
MSRATAAAVNVVLTAYAQGLANDLLSTQRIAQALCPTVTVGGAAGSFKKFSDENSFRSYSTQRGLGGRAKRIEFDAEDGSYNCEPQALEVTIDDHERALADAGGNPLAQELLDQGKIRALVNSAMLSHVTKITDYVIAQTTAVSDRGNWGNDSIDPIDQLDEQLEALAQDVGSTANINLVLGVKAWRTLRNHAKVKARMGAIKMAITPEDLNGMLMFPVNVVVGALSKLTSGVGQATKTKTNVVGDHAILTYSVPNPTIYDPSAFKLFTTGSGMVAAVRTLRDEFARADVHAVDWSEDLQKTSTLAVKRLAITY